MKKIFYALFAAALMISCSETNVEEGGWNADQAQSAIEFFADDADSRTTYFEGEGLSVYWEEGDVVPIIARGYYDKEGIATETRTRYYYKAETAGAATKFVPNTTSVFSWETELTNTGLKLSEQPVDFVSFYCNPTSSSTTIYNGIKVTSDYLQKQAKANDHSHIADYMVMASNMVHREAGDQTPIGFKYTNMMSIVELTLKGDASKSVKSVELYSNATSLAFKSAYLCVEDFTTTADVVEVPYTLYPAEGNGKNSGIFSDKVVLTLTEAAPLSAEGTKFYFVVMPGEHNDSDIILTVNCDDATYATTLMGAVTFEKNKVYKPVVTLTNFQEAEVVEDVAAEVELSGNDAAKVFGTVNFENGAWLINSRIKTNGNSADMAIYNIPENFYHTVDAPWQSLSLMNSEHLDIDVTVKTAGKVYLLVSAHDAKYYNPLVEAGWTAETAVKVSNATAAQIAGFYAGQWDYSFPIFYANAIKETELSSPGYWIILSRYYDANSVFNLKTVVPEVDFRGVRVVAQKITWPVAQAEIQKTAALSDGVLNVFEENALLEAGNNTSMISAANSKGEAKSIPAGYIGLDFFAVKRGTTAEPNCRTVTAKVTKSGMLYQLLPKNAQAIIKPSGKNNYDGWRNVEWFYLGGTTVNPFYISAMWVEAGTEVTTYDYSEKVAGGTSLSNYNTGIFMGDLTVKEVVE